MRPQTLYTMNDLYGHKTLLMITRYLYSKNIDVRPLNIVDKDFPFVINKKNLPIIVYPNGFTIIGIDNIVKYYEHFHKIPNLLSLSVKFSIDNPEYTIC